MRTVNLIQGSPEWHAHRAQHLNASDAPAMLGASTNHSHTDLIRELAAGVPREFSAFVQERVIDPGHEFEAQARAIAEQLVGEDLYPVTGVAGKYSASFDGLTLLEDIAWEHKRLNQALRDAMFDGCTGTDLPLMYQIQMEHQAMVSQCERVFFMASEWRQTSGGWELVEERHCWYVPNPELRARIVAGWAQLEADVAAFEPGPASEPVPMGRAPETLPALSIQVTGMVTASNLAEFKDNALAVLGAINRELQSDEDFANAEKTVTWCKGVEERIEATKQQVLGQTADIDAVFRTMDDVAAETRKIRLELDKLVAKRKEERRTEIGNTARRAVIDHIHGINETLGAHAVPMPTTLVADIAAAIKGKRSFSSMQDAVDAVATNAKITASQAADRILFALLPRGLGRVHFPNFLKRQGLESRKVLKVLAQLNLCFAYHVEYLIELRKDLVAQRNQSHTGRFSEAFREKSDARPIGHVVDDGNCKHVGEYVQLVQKPLVHLEHARVQWLRVDPSKLLHALRFQLPDQFHQRNDVPSRFRELAVKYLGKPSGSRLPSFGQPVCFRYFPLMCGVEVGLPNLIRSGQFTVAVPVLHPDGSHGHDYSCGSGNRRDHVPVHYAVRLTGIAGQRARQQAPEPLCHFHSSPLSEPILP